MAPRIRQLRLPGGTRSRQALLLAAACIILSDNALAASVNVELEGLGGDLKDNVEATLSIRLAEGDLTPGRIRRLHARAPEEIRRALEPFGHYRPVVQATLEADGDDFRAPQGLEKAARLALRMGDRALASELLARLVTEHPESPLRPGLRDLQESLEEDV